MPPTSKRFSSVLAWLEHVRASRPANQATLRKRLSRQRQAASGALPVRLRAGRPPGATSCSTSSRERVRRRWKASARTLLPLLSRQLIRLRVIAKGSLVQASDVRRALRFGFVFHRITKDLTCTLLALLYERSWRDPRLSAYFLSRQAVNLRLHSCPLQATWKSVRQTRAKAPATLPDHRFWPGPAALNAARGPWAWEESTVLGVVEGILACKGGVDAADMVAEMKQLPYISGYFAFGYLRDLHAAGLIHLREAGSAASAMSDNVAAGTSICPLPVWRKALVRSDGRTPRTFQYGDAALVVCETVKALQALGFNIGGGALDCTSDPVQELGGGAGHMLLEFLERCAPLTSQQVHARTGVRSTETSLVDRYLASTSESWDASTHACKGSESLVPLLLPQMRHHGFLVCGVTGGVGH